ncbi:unnamed protein product [Prunus brigantina]
MLGNKTTCQVLGIGTVKINLQDGEVWSLSEVRFVPALKMNLLSLGSLDREGYSYKAEGGKLIVTQGSIVVMRRKIQPNNTHKLLVVSRKSRQHILMSRSQFNIMQLQFIIKGAEAVESKDKIHKGELKRRDDGKDVVEEKLLAKVVLEETPFKVELTHWLTKEGNNNELTRGFYLRRSHHQLQGPGPRNPSNRP